MNWNLIFKLSLFGLAMGIATVWLPTNIETFLWLAIFIICAYIIAKQCTGRYFLHGLMVSLFNCVWMTACHILFYKTYLSNHPEEAKMMTEMPLPDSPRWMMLMVGPIAGTLFGLVLGLFAWVASKMVKK